MIPENRFGTTQEMIIEHFSMDGDTKVIAIDKDGLYFTNPGFLGRKRADINRYCIPRATFKTTLKEAGFDPDKLRTKNTNRLNLQSDPGSSKKLNPIKASKRN